MSTDCTDVKGERSLSEEWPSGLLQYYSSPSYKVIEAYHSELRAKSNELQKAMARTKQAVQDVAREVRK